MGTHPRARSGTKVGLQGTPPTGFQRCPPTYLYVYNAPSPLGGVPVEEARAEGEGVSLAAGDNDYTLE
jgi:hypothetical protein